ncbi:MAG: S-methyl-5-thioribose-1-phosphate isomerase [Gemmataceae bacterium]
MADQRFPRTIEWIGGIDGFVRLIDQTRLPAELAYRDCHTVEDIWEAIRMLRVRGAPAIGIAAAMGVLVEMHEHLDESPAQIADRFQASAARLRTSRPTAVNLFWALERMDACLNEALKQDLSGERLLGRLVSEAQAIAEEDRRVCQALGNQGARLIEDGAGVLTHCNAGALATADYGTALAVLYRASEQGKRFPVYADETRPLLQGARLTTWELQQRGLDVTLICDNMAAQIMKEGRVRLVIVGADRIAANGDTANKIGTYGVAVLARAHGIPFYVAAPRSTFDLRLSDGGKIPIEQRDPREITDGFGKPTAPEGVKVYNPAFDVTPAELIAGLITEVGIITPVNEQTIRQAMAQRG